MPVGIKIIFIKAIVLLALLTLSCSNQNDNKVTDLATFELISASAEVSETTQPISLSYNFVLKNSGRKTIGGMEKPNNRTFSYDDGISIYIEPNEKLKDVLIEVMGINIFEEDQRAQANLGSGKSGTPVLKPNQEGNYNLIFDLGAPEGHPNRRLAPAREQLDLIENNAMEATLVISIEGNEIARFDLIIFKE